MNRDRKQKTRADHVRETVEALKAFDVVHELRGINTEQDMGCADALPLDMVVEKLKPFHDALAFALDQLLMMVEDLETKTTGDYLLKQIIGDQEKRPVMEPESDLEFWHGNGNRDRLPAI